MGMFSLLDTVLDRPLKEILEEIPISEDIKAALGGRRIGSIKSINAVWPGRKGWNSVIGSESMRRRLITVTSRL
jgi:c-di-GMP-related signal transduction protein